MHITYHFYRWWNWSIGIYLWWWTRVFHWSGCVVSYRLATRFHIHSLVLWLIHLLALLQRKHYIPDSAIDFLPKLLSTFFSILCQFYPEISPVVYSFPVTLYRMRQLLNIQEGSFIRYVTCPECSEVYKYDDCIETCGSTKKGKKCKSCGS